MAFLPIIRARSIGATFRCPSDGGTQTSCAVDELRGAGAATAIRRRDHEAVDVSVRA
jgi:hypothetical protein